ncbi:Gibberellin receptor [Ancistrocladus abbreviatus]
MEALYAEKNPFLIWHYRKLNVSEELAAQNNAMRKKIIQHIDTISLQLYPGQTNPGLVRSDILSPFQPAATSKMQAWPYFDGVKSMSMNARLAGCSLHGLIDYMSLNSRIVPLNTWILISNLMLDYNLLPRPDGTFNRDLAEFLDRKVPANAIPVDGVFSFDKVDKSKNLLNRVYRPAPENEAQWGIIELENP